MSNSIEVIAIVEGRTEEIFINSILAPYLAEKTIFMTATQVSKPGQKGGDVRFSRIIKDVERHLKQRSDTYVTTFVDYYGIKEWPNLHDIPRNANPSGIANILLKSATVETSKSLPEIETERRFIPFIAIHEFEALLFSNSGEIARELRISEEEVEAVISKCGEPEAINNSPATAPCKRLDKWSNRGKFPKTTTGIAIAKEIGIETMREKCPLFNQWLERLEQLKTTA